MADPSLIDAYLEELRAALGPAASASTGFLDEVRDHLLSAVETATSSGVSTRLAEEAAVSRFGEPRAVVRGWQKERRRFSFNRSTTLTTLAIATVLVLHEAMWALAQTAGLRLNGGARELLLLAGRCALPVIGLYLIVRLTDRLPKSVLASAALLAAFGAWCSLGGATMTLCALPAGASSLGVTLQVLAVAQWAASLAASAAAVWGLGWMHLTWRVE